MLRPEHYYPALRLIVEKHPFLTVVVGDQHTDKAYYEHVSSIDLSKHVYVISESNLANNFGSTNRRQSRSSSSNNDEVTRIEDFLPALADYAYPAERPPWGMTVMPLEQRSGKTTTATTQRCFIAFAFSHVLGDGMNGLTFHHDLLEGLRISSTGRAPTAHAQNAIVVIPRSTALDEPFDTPQRLPISWSYLLVPFVTVCLPKWFAILFGIRASTSTLAPGTWIGPPMFDSNKRGPSPSPGSSKTKNKKNIGTIIEKDTTNLRVIDIPASQLEAALRMTRLHGSKLTGVLHQIIVHALSDTLPDQTLRQRRRSSSMGFSTDKNAAAANTTGEAKLEPAMAITNFASQTAINMRPTLNIPNSKMGLYVNGCFDYYPRRPRHSETSKITTDSASDMTTTDRTDRGEGGPLTETEWAAAAATSQRLSLCAARLKDQPIGLLRYAPSVRGWMAKKMGQNRDCSYEVSNLLAFTPPPDEHATIGGGEDREKIGIEWIVFAQPRNPTSSPLVFDVVSVAGGNLVISVVWQTGALGDVAGSVEDEKKLVEEVCDCVKAEFARFLE